MASSRHTAQPEPRTVHSDGTQALGLRLHLRLSLLICKMGGMKPRPVAAKI